MAGRLEGKVAGPNLITRMRDPNTPSVYTLGVTGVDKGTSGQPPVIRSTQYNAERDTQLRLTRPLGLGRIRRGRKLGRE